MIAALLLALPAAPLLAPPQDPPAAEAPKKAEKRAFPKLKGPAKKKVEGWLYEVRKSKKLPTAEAARDSLIAEGAAVVPAAIAYWSKVDAKRLPYLVAVLDGVLEDADLDLAWKEVGKKTAPEARVYLVRRIADSRREDAGALLAARLEGAPPRGPAADEE